jgi:hypothetical protein
MTEAEWIACTDPMLMLQFLARNHNFLARNHNKRKALCFSTACCRRLQSLLDEYTCGILSALSGATEVTLSLSEIEAFSNDALAHTDSLSYLKGNPAGCSRWLAAYAVYYASEGNAAGAALRAAQAIECVGKDPAHFNVAVPGPPSLGDPTERTAQVALLRCVFGNPFRKTRVNPVWLSWNDSTVRRMAESIHDERVFELMPVLADALEDAGCSNADILEHCRHPGEHVLGCWVIDLILSKDR